MGNLDISVWLACRQQQQLTTQITEAGRPVEVTLGAGKSECAQLRKQIPAKGVEAQATAFRIDWIAVVVGWFQVLDAAIVVEACAYQRAWQPFVEWHGEQQRAAGLQHAQGFPQCAEVIGNMFKLSTVSQECQNRE
mgnify:CR=1 FL=1